MRVAVKTMYITKSARYITVGVHHVAENYEAPHLIMLQIVGALYYWEVKS